MCLNKYYSRRQNLSGGGKSRVERTCETEWREGGRWRAKRAGDLRSVTKVEWVKRNSGATTSNFRVMFFFMGLSIKYGFLL